MLSSNIGRASCDVESHSYTAVFSKQCQEQETLRIVKYTVITDSRHCDGVVSAAEKCMESCFGRLPELYAEQEEYLSRFWENAETEIYSDDDSSLAMAFNQYQLLQSCGVDGLSSIASKGLSGEGYEGHYFWDTEIYVIPFFTCTAPELARKLLSYRYATLGLARENARLLGHKNGALFPWRTNLFVAGFIGMPQMNLFDAKLVKANGRYTVECGGISVELSEEKQARLAANGVESQDVTLGVRPDHIMLCADGIKGRVDVSELMGSSVHLHVNAEGKDVIVIVPTNGDAAHFPMGSEVNLTFGGNVAHVFDKDGKNLEF